MGNDVMLKVRKLINQLQHVAPDIYNEMIRCGNDLDCVVSTCLKYLRKYFSDDVIKKLINQVSEKIERGEIVV